MNGTIFAAVFIVAVSLWTGGALAQSSSSCTNVLISMSPCLSYIQGNSSTPSSSCCSQLASVVSSQPLCLCEVLNGGASSLGMDVNQTQAMALPTACNVKTPPASQCNASSPSGSPSGTNPPSGGGSKTVPTTDDGTSGGHSAKLSFSVLFLSLFIASSRAFSFVSI
ncbi:zinc finger HIT domain-containing protein 2-like [Hibiscus syriacus]|uniref:Zinc finger HIT domain-containing protein 2-like n=1 Tax=Hibiscus syriacus TaxID=106335 RepID=A0A6A2YAL9_HIBSY|nr:non-specific lipid transfer protein GPI-anchored 19-like [Hibiscus syriacus]KAE8679625.1 zinc finger HIT domain-containing protein 2-like [Hibiscus syriacus]